MAPLFEEYDVVCVCKHPQSIFEVLGVKREEVHGMGCGDGNWHLLSVNSLVSWQGKIIPTSQMRKTEAEVGFPSHPVGIQVLV